MAITGVSLIAFLIVHCYVNSMIFFNHGREDFEAAAHFLGTNLIMHIFEVGLFVGIILHIIQGLMITAQNQSKRPVGYAVKPGNKSSKWYSRSMGLLGTLILLFLVLHLYHFWAPNRYHYVTEGSELSLYDMMKVTFSEWWVVIAYVIGCISLSFHLMHGFWSAFQTLGLSTMKYKKIINGIGIAFAIIVPLIFIMMPVSFYMGWIG